MQGWVLSCTTSLRSLDQPSPTNSQAPSQACGVRGSAPCMLTSLLEGSETVIGCHCPGGGEGGTDLCAGVWSPDLGTCRV